MVQMSDGRDQAMADAGLNLLRVDAGPPALVVFDGPIPAGTQPPYVRVYTHIEWPADDPNNALDGVSGRAVVRWYCHCVGGNDQAARGVTQRVRAALLDKRPAVTGMVPGMIRHEQSIPPVTDETTGTAVLDAVNVYRLTCDT
jgi:hypothetical protein